jgi:hypothetical protein
MPMPPDWVAKNAVNSRSASSTDIPKAAVPHRYQDLLCVVQLRSDHQFARPVGDRLHRLDAAHHQIDEHLLRLDPIGEDRGKGGGEFQLQHHLVGDPFALPQADNLADDVVDVERRHLGIVLVGQTACSNKEDPVQC